MKQSIATFKIIIQKSCAFILAVMMTNVAYANPELTSVAVGNATVTQTATTTQVNQASQQAVIDWKSFNIGANESTHFEQPAGGVALNRIDAAQGASQIYGQLSATGKIILVNGAGIYFGPSAMVNVGSLIASTSGISVANFLAGKYIFDEPSGYRGSVVNDGTIKAADYGLVALLGTSVVNNGLIQAHLGNIVLGSGNKFTLDFYGDQLLNFTIDEEAVSKGIDANGNELQNGVSNTGVILADGGRINISARAAQGVIDDVINMSGIAQARSVSQHNGEIILSGGSHGRVVVSGRLDASGRSAGHKGGSVKVLGNNIHLASTAYIDVSGDVGGGTILVGGNFHGAGPEQNAWSTTVDAGAILNANALTSGNGGQVAVWSDNNTQFHGSIFAQGGSESGDGGFVETSGHYLDIANGQVNTLAANGLTGNWLLDPLNVTIGNNTTTNDALSGGIYTPSATGAYVNAAQLNTALASSNITITTGATGSTGSENGDITVSGSADSGGTATLSWSTNTLTLSAYDNININAGASFTGSGTAGLVLQANNSGFYDAATGGTNNGGLVTNNGSISLASSGALTVYYNPLNYVIVTPASYTAGLGTTTVYRYINSLGTAADLATNSGLTLAAASNATNTGGNVNFALSTNIDATATNNGSGWTTSGFTPIGSLGFTFKGTFDGLNHTISNLYIANTTNATSLAPINVGLFGFVGQDTAVIKNIGLINPIISYNGSINSNNTGNVNIGSLVGESIGTISNSYSQGGSITTNATFVNGGSGGTGFLSIGGLVGNMTTNGLSGSVLNSYSTTDVLNTIVMNVGGSGTIPNNKIYIGGLIGLSTSSKATVLSQDYAANNVTVNESSVADFGNLEIDIGGLAGSIGDFNNTSGNKNYDNNYSLANINVTLATSSGGGTTVANLNPAVGGLYARGYNFNITKSLAASTISVSSPVTYILGGLIAGTSNANYPTTNTISTSFFDSTTSGTGIGIPSGSSTSTTGTPIAGCLSGSCPNGGTANLSNISTYTGQGWDIVSTANTSHIWGITAGVNGGYPYLQSHPPVLPGFTLSGTALASGQTINLAANNGTVLYSAVSTTGGAFSIPSVNITAGQTYLFYITGGNSNIVSLATGVAQSGFNFAANTLTIGDTNANTYSNSILNSAKGSLNSADILYILSAGNLTLTNNINMATSASSTYNISGNITGSGTSSLTFNGPTSLTGAAVLTAGSGGISLPSISGANALTLTSSGTKTLRGAVSGLTSLTMNGGGSSAINTSSVSTAGAQTYTDLVTLSSATTTLLNSANSSNITFGSSVNGVGKALTITNSGTNSGISINSIGSSGNLLGALNFTSTGTGTTALANAFAASLTTNGNASLGVGTMTTSGAQTYNGAVTLTGASNLTSTAGALSLANTVNGGFGLTLTGNTGITLSGIVGGTSALASLSATASTISAASVTTSGSQNYSGAITLNGAYKTAGGAFAVGSAATLAGATSIDTTNAGGTAAGANINFFNTINGGQTLNLTSGTLGGISLSNVIGSTTALTSLTANGKTISTFGVSTTGAQNFTGSTSTTLNGSYLTAGNVFNLSGPALLTGFTNIDTTNGGGTATGANISFNNTINNAQNFSLTAGSVGTITLGGAVGGSTALTSITTSGAGSLVLPAITVTGNAVFNTIGAISQTGILTAQGASSFNAGANAITLTQNNVLTGNVALINSGANNVSLTNNGLLSLGSVSVGSGTLTLNGIGITGANSIVQAVSAGAATFNAGAGVINLTAAGNNFRGTLSLNNSGANNVTINSVNALTLGASSVGSGTLSITGVGITGTGAISQAVGAGLASFTAGLGVINLNNASNNFTGSIALSNTSNNAVTLVNNAPIVLGTSSIGSAAFNLAANGSITQVGTLTSSGAITITQNSATSQNIILDQSNNLTGSLAFAAGATLGKVNNFTLVNTSATNMTPTNLYSLTALNNLSLTYTNSGLTFTSPLSLTGSLNATVAGALNTGTGLIQTQGGNVTLATTTSGTANTLTIGTGGITTNGGSVTATVANPTNLNPVLNVNGTINTTGGSSGAGTLTIGGGVNLAVNPILSTVNSGSVTLQGNGLDLTFTSPLTFSGNTILQANRNILINGTGVLQTSSGNLTINAGVTTQGTQSSSGLTNVALLLQSGASIASAGSLSLSAANNSSIVLNGAIASAINNPVTLTVAAGAGNKIVLGGNVSASGSSATFNGAVNLTAPVTFAGNDFFFNSTVDGAQALTLPGNATFGGAVGGTTALSSISVNGTSAVNTGTVNTTGAQSYSGLTTLGNALVTFNSSTSGDINFAGIAGATDSMTANAVGNILFNGVVSNVTNLTANAGGTLSTSAAISSIPNGNISLTSVGTETIGGAVTAGGSGTVTLNATGAGSDVLLNANVASTSGAINVTASHNTTLNAGNITTSGNVNLTGTTGTVSEAGAGLISAALLTTHSVGGTSLTNANTVSSFNATNSGSGNISLIDTAAPLTITGINQTGGGSVSVNNTGALTTSGAISTAANGDITVTSSGTETIGSAITAGGSGIVTLNATGASSDILLNANVASTSGAINLSAGRNDTLNAGNITTTGNVSLSAVAGAISEAATGLISGALLTTNSALGTLLNNTNIVTSFNGTDNSST
ncbi:MAG: hypothetical protein P4M12_02570, partial [Gammaproteobacteria bacterium]|nr:hypothetical protein [Gammaproteobacteria bacterium]